MPLNNPGGGSVADGSITPAKLAAGLMAYRDVQLNNAQIKALPTTPVEIIPAPITGTIVPFALFFRWDSQSGIYTNVGPGAYFWTTLGTVSTDVFGIYVALTTGDAVVTGLWGMASSLLLTPNIPGVAGTVQYGQLNAHEVVGQNMILAAYNTTDGNDDLGDFTGGNAANTLRIRVWYAIAPDGTVGA